MKHPLYFSFFIFTLLLTDANFSPAYGRSTDEGWGQDRYEEEAQYDREDRRYRAQLREEQEREKTQQEARRKKYRSLREVTSIFDAVSRKISDDDLGTVFRALQSTFGDDVTYQIMDNLSEKDMRTLLLENFFGGDDLVGSVKIILDDNFYAQFLASLTLSKFISDSTVQILQDLMEQKLFKRWENIQRLKNQIIAKQMGYIPEKELAPLVNIINKTVKNTDISEDFILAAFENIKETFDYTFAYQLLHTHVDKNIRSQLVREPFFEGKPVDKTKVVINPQFYATLIDALYQDKNIEPADVDIFVHFAENVLKRNWPEINDLRMETMSQSEDAWGGADHAEQIKTRELENILRQRNINTDKIKAQFIIDFITTYLQTRETVDISAFGRFGAAQDTRLDRFKAALKSVKSSYNKKISDKRYARNIPDANFSKDFTSLIDEIEKKTMQIDGPRYTPWLFQTYLSKLTNQNLKKQILNGIRVDVKKAFAHVTESQTNGKPVHMNSDMLYLLCIQLIGSLEQEMLKSDSVTKVQDFIKNTKELIQVILPSKLNSSGVVMGVLQTILQTIPAQIQKPDANILFGVGIFNMIKAFDLSGPIQQRLVQRIQPTLAQMGINNQTVAQYEAQMVQHLQQLKLITADSTQKLDIFNQKEINSVLSQDKSKSVLERTVNAVDSASKTPVGKNFFSRIFG
ncbi:MAG: hypothetical protein COY39_05880 [Alphaproteobacteria bacterium CG_4_10_14_0_8_um_filter_37_21]|nr:MAG: hypothetical protein COY39_05880 [Alphaproteobacteria bacterium CG_4_10_14_0_8_um_filter_37_21]